MSEQYLDQWWYRTEYLF